MKNFVGTSLFSSVLLLGSVSSFGNNSIKAIRDINKGVKEWPGQRGRIINGQPATDGQFPYYIFIIIRGTTRTNQTSDKSYCGGSIISSIWAMTAGHCYEVGSRRERISYKLDAGMTVRGSPRQSTIVDQSNARRHPSYNDNRLENDVALLKFSGLIFDTYVGSIDIAPTAWNTPDRYAGQSVRVCGFGYTSNNGPISNILYWITQTGTPIATCRSAYTRIPSTCFCAQDSAGGSSICSGDSGGPMTMMLPGTQTPIQIGVVSFGSAGGCNTAPQGYTNVAAMYSWIYATMNS
ncbi:serine proteases 1/2-like [Sergentomyia squamirostris]